MCRQLDPDTDDSANMGRSSQCCLGLCPAPSRSSWLEVTQLHEVRHGWEEEGGTQREREGKVERGEGYNRMAQTSAIFCLEISTV